MESNVSVREHQKPATQPYSLVAALVVACIAAIAVAAYLGVVGMGTFSVSSALFGLGFIELILALGLAYVLFTLHSALTRNSTSEQPYGMVGALTLSGIAAVGAFAYLGAVGIGAFSVRSSLFGLAFIELFLAIGLCYVLFTLRSSLISREDNDQSYGIIGALLVMAVAGVATLAYFGVIGTGLFSERSALFGLAWIELVLALGLCYVLFTMKGAITELRYQRATRAEARRVAEARPAKVAAASSATNASPAKNAWTPLPQRKGMHAAKAHGAPAIEIEGIGPQYAARLKERGIKTMGDVKDANPEATAAAIQVNPTTFRQWQSMADLMEVNGIGKQYSELLVRSGVNSVDELATSNPAVLFATTQKMEATNLEGSRRVSRIQGTHLKVERIRVWVAEADRIS